MAKRSVTKICLVEGCGGKSFGRGFCNKHYKRWQHWGDPTLIRTRQICIMPDCGAYRCGRGYCRKHYVRVRRHGSADYELEPLSETNPQPFWDRVAITNDPDECWEWQAGTVVGYGRVSFKNQPTGTHRLAYFFTHGTWPPVVRHSCDNPPCCNPNHLLGGTLADNNRDKLERGRQTRGEANGTSKLTASQVQEIRRRVEHFSTGTGKGSPNSKKSLAKEFGVSPRIIYLIAANRLWTHVT